MGAEAARGSAERGGAVLQRGHSRVQGANMADFAGMGKAQAHAIVGTGVTQAPARYPPRSGRGVGRQKGEQQRVPAADVPQRAPQGAQAPAAAPQRGRRLGSRPRSGSSRLRLCRRLLLCLLRRGPLCCCLPCLLLLLCRCRCRLLSRLLSRSSSCGRLLIGLSRNQGIKLRGQKSSAAAGVMGGQQGRQRGNTAAQGCTSHCRNMLPGPAGTASTGNTPVPCPAARTHLWRLDQQDLHLWLLPRPCLILQQLQHRAHPLLDGQPAGMGQGHGRLTRWVRAGGSVSPGSGTQGGALRISPVVAPCAHLRALSISATVTMLLHAMPSADRCTSPCSWRWRCSRGGRQGEPRRAGVPCCCRAAAARAGRVRRPEAAAAGGGATSSRGCAGTERIAAGTGAAEPAAASRRRHLGGGHVRDWLAHRGDQQPAAVVSSKGWAG